MRSRSEDTSLALFPGSVEEVSPRLLKEQLSAGRTVVVDVREKEEFEAGHIEAAISLPLMEVEQHLDMFKNLLSSGENIVLCCRSGARSRMVLEWLQEQGISRVRELAGGLRRYAEEIDPNLVVY